MSFSNDFQIRAVALDLDGVVYEGEHVIEGAVETIDMLREWGIDVYFVTNNSGKKRASLAAKLNTMGIISNVDHILTSGYSAAILIDRLSVSRDERILIIGSNELEEEIALLNGNVIHELPADILVVGFDKAFNYERLSLGLNALRQGATFVACNRDRVFPVGNDQVLPACGPIVAALEWASGREADYVAGKPNSMMLEWIAQERGFKPHDILVVGDTIESDIAMAIQFGCPSVLIAHDDSLQSVTEEMHPTFFIRSVEQLLTIINESRSCEYDMHRESMHD
jgi:HAD superfamily hydrolase (TIGR01450 family)